MMHAKGLNILCGCSPAAAVRAVPHRSEPLAAAGLRLLPDRSEIPPQPQTAFGTAHGVFRL